MSFSVEIESKAHKWLEKAAKHNPNIAKKITRFITNQLANSENPCSLPNAKKLSGFSDNRYRWRLGDYRIIGIVKNGEFRLIEIIKITKKR